MPLLLLDMKFVLKAGISYQPTLHHARISFQQSFWVQEALQVDTQQIQMARVVWQQVSQELNGLEADRAALLSRIQDHESQPLAWLSHASEKATGTAKLLGLVAELTKNALLQHEVMRHATRIFAWQICSPDTSARSVCHSCPAFPDFVGILKAMAAMPDG